MIEEEKDTMSVKERTYRKAYKELLDFIKVNEKGLHQKVVRALFAMGYKDMS
jgi:hypothetical protein